MTRLYFPGQLAPMIWFENGRPVACVIPSRNVPGRFVGYINTPAVCREVGPLPLAVAIEKIEAEIGAPAASVTVPLAA